VRILWLFYKTDLPECELILRLHAQGVRQTVVADPVCAHLARYRAAGIPAVAMVIRSAFDWQRVREIRRLLQDERHDVLYASNSRQLACGLWAVYGLQVGVVAYRGTCSLNRLDPMAWLSYLNPRVNRIVCLSDGVRRSLLARGLAPGRLVTVYKGHDPAWYAGLAAPELGLFGIPPSAFVVGCAASMRPLKGVDVLIRALARLPAGHNVHLLLIGEVRDRRVAQLARSAACRERVHLTGYRSDAPALLGRCHVAVMPSRSREGLGKAVIEAMAQAVPAIVTRVGGLPEVVEDGVCGRVVPPDDPGALAAAILEMAGDPGLRREFGRNARRRIEQRFHIDDTQQRMMAVLGEAAGGVAPGPVERAVAFCVHRLLLRTPRTAPPA